MDVDDLNKQFGIKAQNLSDNEAYNQYQNDNIATLRGRVEENVYKNESGDKTLKQVQGDSSQVQSDRLEGDRSQGQGDWVNEYAKEHPEVLNDDELLFQSASSAGVGANNVEDAQREWEEKGTDSKYFKKWFVDSKVVDSEGKPLVVYHGTLNNFEAFDKNTIGDRYSYDSRGFFFTSSKNIANDYATSDFDSSKKGVVMPVYLSIQNPLVIDNNFVKKEGMGGVFKQEDSISFWDNYQDFVLDTFDEGNYDGIIIDDGDTKMFVAFEPNQIKSVDNRGTFDSNSGNIYYQPIDNNTNDTLYRADGKPVKIEYYDNSDIKDVKPLNIANLRFENKQEKDIKNSDIKQEVFHGKKKLKITNSKSSITATLPIGKIDEMVNDIFKNIKKDGKYVRLKKEIITNVETIFENAIPILQHSELEEKNKSLYDKQIIHRFALPVKIGGKEFFSMITVKERLDSKEMNVEEFTIYDLHSKNISKEMTDSKSQDETSLSRSQSSNISITDLVDFVNTHLNKYRKSLHQNNNIQYQSMTKEQLLNVYMNQEFGMSADDITDMVTEDIKNILTDYDVSEDEFKFEDIRIYGSYSKGTNKVGSDLDIVVQYSGSMREDSAFNMLHDEELSVYDKKGNKYS